MTYIFQCGTCGGRLKLENIVTMEMPQCCGADMVPAEGFGESLRTEEEEIAGLTSVICEIRGEYEEAK